MIKIKTFEKDFKPGITLQFINFLVELAEGFEYDDEYENWLVYFKPNEETYIKHTFINDSLAFSTLLHRAVEGWNKLNKQKKIYIDYVYERVYYIDEKLKIHNFDFKNYQPCHLTACEMAIWHCLCEVFNETKER